MKEVALLPQRLTDVSIMVVLRLFLLGRQSLSFVSNQCLDLEAEYTFDSFSSTLSTLINPLFLRLQILGLLSLLKCRPLGNACLRPEILRLAIV